MKQVFYGLFVHSLTASELEFEENGAIGVEDESIAFIERGVTDLWTIISRYKFEGAQVHKLGPKQFLFPGMIDTHIVCCSRLIKACASVSKYRSRPRSSFTRLATSVHISFRTIV